MEFIKPSLSLGDIMIHFIGAIGPAKLDQVIGSAIVAILECSKSSN